jgi:hypothetical protein
MTRIENNDFDGATDLGVQFIQAVFPDILHHLPT